MIGYRCTKSSRRRKRRRDELGFRRRKNAMEALQKLIFPCHIFKLFLHTKSYIEGMPPKGIPGVVRSEALRARHSSVYG